MTFIDAVAPLDEAVQISARAAIEAHEKTVLQALFELKLAARALPAASPLRELLEDQAQLFALMTSRAECQRYVALAADQRTHT